MTTWGGAAQYRRHGRGSDRSGASLRNWQARTVFDLSTSRMAPRRWRLRPSELAATARAVANGAAGAADAASRVDGRPAVVLRSYSHLLHPPSRDGCEQGQPVLQDLAAQWCDRQMCAQRDSWYRRADQPAGIECGDRGGVPVTEPWLRRGCVMRCARWPSVHRNRRRKSSFTIEQLQEGATAAVQAMEHGRQGYRRRFADRGGRTGVERYRRRRDHDRRYDCNRLRLRPKSRAWWPVT